MKLEVDKLRRVEQKVITKEVVKEVIVEKN
jgi:hypothetical protein